MARAGMRDIAPLTTSFTELGLAEPILKALAAEGHVTPTPIQMQSIPTALEGRDVFGIAQTGTGKTAAFALPIIHRLLGEKRAAPRRGCQALVLSPTRELASQIANTFRIYARFANLSVTTVFGGVNARPQAKALARGADIVVATPGRLLDHIRSGNCDLSATGILVLDEADQMLDLGFHKPICAIAAKTCPQRQSLFFSATLPKEIEALAADLLKNPISVRVTPVSSTAERVDQEVIHIPRARKSQLLINLLTTQDMARTLVFTRTKRGADALTRQLVNNGVEASAIHGNKSQGQREQALRAFRAAKIQVLVATDIAARGIDIPEVSHVVNYELPEVPESYVHRIGRTARAGRAGKAISLCDPSERGLLRQIERLTKQPIASDQNEQSDQNSAEDDGRAPPRRSPQRAPQNRRRSGPPPRTGAPRTPEKTADAGAPPQHKQPKKRKRSDVAAKASSAPSRKPRRDDKAQSQGNAPRSRPAAKSGEAATGAPRRQDRKKASSDRSGQPRQRTRRPRDAKKPQQPARQSA